MDYLPYLIAGLVTGSVYGLAGTGLVLTYKTSGVFNLAHGALATVSAYVFYELDVDHGLPWGLSASICVLVVGPILGLAFELLARTLAGSSLAVKVASTIGVLLIVESVISLHYSSADTLVVPQFLPQQSFTIDSTPVTDADVIVVSLALVAAAGLFAFFRFTRLGVSMRAVVDNPDLLDVSGTNPVQVRRCAWIIGVSFASASGVLLAPLLAQLNALNLTFLVVTAFGAAAFGAFTNLPMTYLGGIVIGVAQQLCSKFFTTGLLTGLNPALPFLVLFVVLLIFPRSKLRESSRVVPRKRAASAPWQIQAVGGVAVLVLLVFIPQITPLHVTDWTNGLSYVMVFLSLGLLVRTSGQVSLAHISFMAIGVCAMSHLTLDHHVPWAFALILSGLIAVPIGAILSIPAIRLSGLYLALSTFGFGILLQYMFYTESFMFGSTGLGLTVPRPHLGGLSISSDNGYYYLVLILATATSLITVAMNHSRLGRLLRALADSPTGLATSGASVNVTRVMVFCLSAFLAAMGGALQGVSAQQVTGDSYSPLLSLLFFALIMISIGNEPWYALIAAFGFVIIPTLSVFSSANTSNWLQLLFGAGAVLYAVGDRPAETLLARFGRDRPDRMRSGPVSATSALPATRRSRVVDGSLRIEGIRVQFGGLVAVNGVSLDAPTGRITGLIGPNGAGKTTTFNACSGLNRPSAGRIVLNGRDISRRGPAARARRGLGRTFQQMELFDSLSVRQNVELGVEGGFAGLNVLSHLASTRGQARRVQESTNEALTLCGVSDLAGRTAGSLSTGQRRLVELARCLAGPSQVLLLDEPSSGLDRAETQRFGEILTEAVAERGVGILLVEHDMSLVTRVCDHIYVLDFGKPIFDGSTDEVLASRLVQAAYLGGDEVEEQTLDAMNGHGSTTNGTSEATIG